MLIIGGVIFTFSSCSDQAEIELTSNELTNDEIIELLKTDVDFQNYFKESREFQKVLFSSFLSKSASEKIELKDIPKDIHQLNAYLNLPEENSIAYLYKSSNLVEKLINKYPSLGNLNKDEISSIVNSAKIENSEKSVYLDYKAYTNTCQEQYEASFRRIHAEYDQGVETCLIIGLATFGTGLIPCNATNVYNTFHKLAVAEDQYNACMN